jgi:YgiT-type zinc finger domain-containing protein
VDEGFREPQAMICLICRQAEVVEGLTAVSFERAEDSLEVRNVPARICPGCGEAYVDEQTAARLLHIVNEAFGAGLREEVFEYDG